MQPEGRGFRMRRTTAFVAALLLASTGCGLIPGTSDAGLAGVPAAPESTLAPPVGPVDGGGSTETTVSDGIDFFQQETTTTTLPIVGETVPSTSTTIPWFKIPTTDVELCTATAAMARAGDRVHDLGATGTIPEYAEAVGQVREQAVRIVSHSTPELRPVAESFVPVVMQAETILQQSSTPRQIVDGINRLMKERGSTVDTLLSAIERACPGVSGPAQSYLPPDGIPDAASDTPGQ